MDRTEIEAIYDEMSTLTVHLTMAPELGPDYLKEKLTECRQKQNRTLELFLRLSRATSTLRLRLQSARQAVKVAGGSAQAEEFRRQIPGLSDEFDSCRFALEALKVVRSNLNRVQTEIRTLTDIVVGRTGERRGMSDHIPDLPPGANTGVAAVSPEESMRQAMEPDYSLEDLVGKDTAATEEAIAGVPEPAAIEPPTAYPHCATCRKVLEDCGCDGYQGSYIPGQESVTRDAPVSADEVQEFFSGEVTTPPPTDPKAKKSSGDEIDIASLL